MKLSWIKKLSPEFGVLMASVVLLSIGAAWVYHPLGLIVPGFIGLMDVMLGRFAKQPEPTKGNDE